MRYVDHDPGAARAAALQCRAAAEAYERIAGTVAVQATQAAWWGAERDRVVAGVEDLATDLRREAMALRDTAYGLEVAARAAERRNAELVAEAEAAAAAAAVCPPTSSGHSVTHASSTERSRRSSSSGSSTRTTVTRTGATSVPTGVQ